MKRFLPLMALVTMLAGGCSRFLYTADEWRLVERDLEAVEEELDDLSKESEAKRQELEGYVSQIDEMERERRLYDNTMARVREAFLQDLDETSRRMDSLSATMDDVQRKSARYSTRNIEQLSSFEESWVKKYDALLKAFCSHWKCENDSKGDGKGNGEDEKVQ